MQREATFTHTRLNVYENHCEALAANTKFMQWNETLYWENLTCGFVERHNSKLTSLLSSSVWLWICCAMACICRPKQSCPLTLKVEVVFFFVCFVLVSEFFCKRLLLIKCYWHLLVSFIVCLPLIYSRRSKVRTCAQSIRHPHGSQTDTGPKSWFNDYFWYSTFFMTIKQVIKPFAQPNPQAFSAIHKRN